MCDAALVGGVNLLTHPYHEDLLLGLDMLSGDCECRPLGAQATGWLAGEGVGAVLIKRLKTQKETKTIFTVL
jgi:polyketide synthase PksN